jgi:hypothetical protein
MKVVLTAVAWLGLLVILGGTYFSFLTSIRVFPAGLLWNRFGPFGEMGELGFGYAFFIGCIGTFLALIGGLIAQPRYLWVGLVIVGSIYIISFLEFIIAINFYYPEHRMAFIILESVSVLPGVVCIIEGIIIRWLRKRHKILRPAGS